CRRRDGNRGAFRRPTTPEGRSASATKERGARACTADRPRANEGPRAPRRRPRHRAELPDPGAPRRGSRSQRELGPYAVSAALVGGITAPMSHSSGMKMPKMNNTQCPFLRVMSPMVNRMIRYKKKPPKPIPHHMPYLPGCRRSSIHRRHWCHTGRDASSEVGEPRDRAWSAKVVVASPGRTPISSTTGDGLGTTSGNANLDVATVAVWRQEVHHRERQR